MISTIPSYFHEITQIPRPSKKEDKMRDWLVKRAEKKSLQCKVDTAGNLIVYVPATEDKKSSPTVILQSHMDMVCVSTPESEHDFSNDPIQTYEKDGRLYANGTTLGADNGMGIAMMLAAVEEESRPALELMFTIDEETGLTGALTFDPSCYTGDYLINLDTEDFGEICISSAGGARINGVKKYEQTKPTQSNTIRIKLNGMKGGHSGIEIDRNRGHAILALVDLLQTFSGNLSLHSFQGGQADNAIPGRTNAVIAVDNIDLLEKHAAQFVESYKEKYDCPDLEYQIESVREDVMTIEESKALLGLLSRLPNGIQSMSKNIEGLVQTSLNLGIVELADGELSTTHATRSSVMEELDQLIENVTKIYKSDGFQVELKSKYPGRQQSPDDNLVVMTKSAFKKTTGEEPEIVAYHAGLECGAIVERMGRPIQAVSFGPTIKNAHSPQECVEIETINKSYLVLIEILKNM